MMVDEWMVDKWMIELSEAFEHIQRLSEGLCCGFPKMFVRL